MTDHKKLKILRKKRDYLLRRSAECNASGMQEKSNFARAESNAISWAIEVIKNSFKPQIREDLSKVTRLEVIDHTSEKGRAYYKMNENIQVEESIQDEGRTLKIFISSRSKNE